MLVMQVIDLEKTAGLVESDRIDPDTVEGGDVARF